jgi:hypothetical protein
MKKRTLVRSLRVEVNHLAWLRQAAEEHNLQLASDAEMIRFAMFAGLDRLTAHRWRTLQPEPRHIQAVCNSRQALPSGADTLMDTLDRLPQSGQQPSQTAHSAEPAQGAEPTCGSSKPVNPTFLGETPHQKRGEQAAWLTMEDQPEALPFHRLVRIPLEDPRTGQPWTREKWPQYEDFLLGVVDFIKRNYPLDGERATQLESVRRGLKRIQQEPEKWFSDPKTLLDNPGAV